MKRKVTLGTILIMTLMMLMAFPASAAKTVRVTSAKFNTKNIAVTVKGNFKASGVILQVSTDKNFKKNKTVTLNPIPTNDSFSTASNGRSTSGTTGASYSDAYAMSVSGVNRTAWTGNNSLNGYYFTASGTEDSSYNNNKIEIQGTASGTFARSGKKNSSHFVKEAEWISVYSKNKFVVKFKLNTSKKFTKNSTIYIRAKGVYLRKQTGKYSKSTKATPTKAMLGIKKKTNDGLSRNVEKGMSVGISTKDGQSFGISKSSSSSSSSNSGKTAKGGYSANSSTGKANSVGTSHSSSSGSTNSIGAGWSSGVSDGYSRKASSKGESISSSSSHSVGASWSSGVSDSYSGTASSIGQSFSSSSSHSTGTRTSLGASNGYSAPSGWSVSR